MKNVTDTPIGSTIQSIDAPIAASKLSTLQAPIETEIVPDIEIPSAQPNGQNDDKMGSLNVGHNEV